MSEAGGLAVETAVAPCGVAGGRLDDETTQIYRGAGLDGCLARSGPVAGDSASVPTQQGLWRNESANSPRARQNRRDSAQQRLVLIGESRSVVLPAQVSELVAQHDDLEVRRAPRVHSQPCRRHDQLVQNATHRTPECKRVMPDQPHDHILSTHRPTRPIPAQTPIPLRRSTRVALQSACATWQRGATIDAAWFRASRTHVGPFS